MADPSSDANTVLINLLPMVEAVMTAYLKVVGEGSTPVLGRNVMAGLLAGMVPLYVYLADRSNVRLLTPDEISGGTFVDGGRQLEFGDARAPASDIVVTRTALNAAIEMMRRSGTAKALCDWRSERGK
jgi:hypothetical protein